MPRVNLGKPSAQLRIEQELRSRYRNRINKSNVAEYLGQSRFTVRQWMRDLPAAATTGKYKVYTPERVARAIYELGDPGAWD